MRIPTTRGPLSEAAAAGIASGTPLMVPSAIRPSDGLTDDDLQLALWMLYELHYRGFEDGRLDAEWDPALLGFRATLERWFMDALRAEVKGPCPVEASAVPAVMFEMTAADSGRSLSRYLQRDASRAQFEEFVIHRSVYHLKEADPHSWAIPRLTGPAKAAMVEIQFDEYGAGRYARMHSTLFAEAMQGLGLDSAYGAYVDAAPGVTLAQSNLISLFGLHYRWRGALAGHLGAFEMTSTEPNRRYAMGYRRVGGRDSAARFYDEHVGADALHEQIAAHDLCGSLAVSEPALVPDILFGAAACLHLDDRFADHVFSRWDAGLSSLPVPEASAR